MTPSKWQEDFQVRPDDRLYVKKQSVFSLQALLRYVFSKIKRLTWGLGISACVMIGLIWYFSVFSGPVSQQSLPVIDPPKGPFKIKPAPQESDQTVKEDQSIYEKLSAVRPNEKLNDRVEHLLQEPEEPISEPPSLPENFIGSLIDDSISSEKDQAVLSKETETKDDAEKQRPSVQTVTPSPSSAPSFASAEQASSLGKDVQPRSFDQGGVATPQEKGKELSQEQDRLFVASPKGTHWVQLASLKTRENAEKEWKRLMTLTKVKALLKTFTPVYDRVDMGETEGVRYRLRVGLLSGDDAKSLCQKLKNQKIDCLSKKAR